MKYAAGSESARVFRLRCGACKTKVLTFLQMEKHGYPKLTFPAAELRMAKRNGQDYVWDASRGKYLLYTPEEHVRRHVMAYLESGCGVPVTSMAQEYPVMLNGQPQRADIVVIGRDGKPLMLVECKAPDVRITRAVLSQAVRYNSVVGARYVILTNGIDHFCYEFRDGAYSPMSGFPNF